MVSKSNSGHKFFHSTTVFIGWIERSDQELLILTRLVKKLNIAKVMAKKPLFLEAFSRGVELTTFGSTLYVELYVAYSIVLEHVELYTVILPRGTTTSIL